MDKTKHNQSQIQSALRKAQKSTASSGKYDKNQREEKDLKKNRKDKPLNDMIKEGDRQLKMIDRLSIDEAKVKLNKNVARKLGAVGDQDKSKDSKSLKKKHAKEVDKRTRKMTEKKFKIKKKG